MPDPRKKLYSALSSKYDLGSYDEFNSKMNNPESRKKLFDSASKNFDLGSYNDFESKVKKKEVLQPTSQKNTSDSKSKLTTTPVSLDTEETQVPVESDGLDGQTKMKTFTGLTPEEQSTLQAKPVTKLSKSSDLIAKKLKLQKELSTIKVTPENQDEVLRKTDELSSVIKAQDEIKDSRLSEIENQFKQAKNEESVKLEADKRLNDLLTTTGVWNNIKATSLNIYNKVIDQAASITDEPGLKELKADVDPLSEEKKEVKKDAAKKKIKLNDQQVTELAKNLYKDKQVDYIETDNINSFLDDLDEEDKNLLRQSRRQTAEHLQENNLKEEKVINAYEVIGNKKIKEYKNLEQQLLNYKNNNQPLPKDVYDAYVSLGNEIVGIGNTIEKKQSVINKNKEDLGTAQQEIDLLKRRYGDIDNAISNIGLGGTKILNGILGFTNYAAKFGGGLQGELYSMAGQKTTDKINQYISEEESQLRKGVESIESPEGFINYVSDIVSKQIPNLVATSTGVGGLGVVGIASTGEKFTEMNKEVLEGNATYSPLQMAVAPVLWGSAEVISEIPTLSILTKGGRVFDSIVKNEGDLITKSVKEKAKEWAKDWSIDMSKEVAGEEFTNFTQNFTDKYVLGKKDVGLLDNAGTVLKDTFTLTNILKAAPHVAGAILKPLQTNKDLNTLDENSRKIIEFSKQLKNESLTDIERSVINKQINKATFENSTILNDTIGNINNMPDDVYRNIIDLNNKIADIKTDAFAINEGNLPNKAELIKDLQQEYKATQEERNALIDTKYEPTEEVVVEETRIKDSQIPLNRETFEVKDENGNVYSTIVTTKKDGSRELVSKDKDGRVASSENIGKENTLTTEEYITKGYGDIQGKSKVEQGNDIMNPAMKEKLTSKQKAELGIAEIKPTIEEKVTEEVVAPTGIADEYIQSIEKVKTDSPETFWSVDRPFQKEDGTIDKVQLDKAAEEGRIIKTESGFGVVGEDGDIKGVFKSDLKSTEKTGDKVIQEAIKKGGIKLDNFALPNLMKIYERNGFREVSRLPFNEEYAPEGWTPEQGTPDVVAMVYDPNGELNIEKKSFTDYDEAMKYRDGYVSEIKVTKVKPIVKTKLEAFKAKYINKPVYDRTKLDTQVDNAKKSLSKALPNVKFVVHDTKESFIKEAGKSGRGYYDPATVTIHINALEANARTVAHEVFHSVLLEKVKTDANARELTKRMISSIAKTLEGNPDLKNTLDDFINNYDENVQSEEKMAELFGYLADGYEGFDAPTKSIIKRAMDRLAKMFGLTPFTEDEIVDMLKTLSGKVATGQEIVAKDIKIIKEQKTIKDAVKKFQADFIDPKSKVEFVYDKNTEKFKKLEEEGYITKDMSIEDFNGQTIFLHQPDAAFSGEIYKNGEPLVEGKGGVYYPIKFHEDGYFWASTETTANKMAKDLNAARKANGGKLLMALTSAPSDKLLSSTTAANGVMEIISSKAFDRSFSLNKEQVKKSLIDAANKVVEIEGKKVGLGLVFKKGASLEEVKSEISKKLGPDNSSFADRKAFVKSFISNTADIVKQNPKAIDQFGKFFSEGIKNESFKGITKTGKLSISAANMTQAISEMLTEPMLKEGIDRNKGGQVYAILELNGDVKPIDSNKHESYPKAIQSVDSNNKVKLHILKDRVQWSDVFEDPTTGNIVTKERQLNIFPTSGVSTQGLMLNTNKGRMQESEDYLDMKDIVKDMIDDGMSIMEIQKIISSELGADQVSLAERVYSDLTTVKQSTPVKTEKVIKEQPSKGKQKERSVLKRIKEGGNAEYINEIIDKVGINYTQRNQQQVISDAEAFVDEVGIENAYEAIKNGSIKNGDSVTVIYASIIDRIPNIAENAIEDAKTESEKETVRNEYNELLETIFEEFSKRQTDIGQATSILNALYIKNQEVMYSLPVQKEKYMAVNAGVIDEDTLKKFEALNKRYSDANKKIKELESKLKESIDEQNFKNIIEDFSRVTSNENIGSKARSLAKDIRSGKKTILPSWAVAEAAKGTKTQGLTFEKTFAKALETFADVHDATKDFAKAIEESFKVIKQWYEKNNIDFNENDIKLKFSEYVNPKTKKLTVTKGVIKIPSEIISNYVVNGGSDINELSEQILNDSKDEYPNLTVREIRDKISNYGSRLNKTRTELNDDILRLKSLGRLESQLEDLKKGISKSKNEIKKRALSDLEKKYMVQIKAIKKNLGIEDIERTTANENYVRKKIEELKEKIKNNDFSKKEVTPIKESEELKKLKTEKNRVQEEYDKIIYTKELENRTVPEKITGFLSDMWDAQRVTRATGELSFVGAQGGFYMINSTFSRKTFNSLVKNFKGTSLSDWVKSPIKTISNIIRSATSAETIIEMFNKMGNKNNYDDYQSLLKAHPYYDVFLKSKLRILSEDIKTQVRDEMFIGNHFLHILKLPFTALTEFEKGRKRITLQGYYEKFKTGKVSEKNIKTAEEIFEAVNPLGAFERGNNTFMNMARVEMFMDGVQALEMQGKNPVDHLQDYKDLASAVNTITGTGNLNKQLSMALPMLNKLFFSPRFWAASLNMTPPVSLYYLAKLGNYDNVTLSNPKTWGSIRPTVAQKAFVRPMLKGFIAFYGMSALVVSLINSALDDDDEMTEEEKNKKRAYIEYDPRSSDFMQVVSGDTKTDFFGPYRNNIVLFSRLFTGQTNKGGNIIENGAKWGSRTDFQIASEYIAGKANPFPGMFVRYSMGKKEEVLNEETNLKENRRMLFEDRVGIDYQTKENLMPIFVGTVKDIVDEDPVLGSAFYTTLALFGKQTSVYKKKSSSKGEMSDSDLEKLKTNNPNAYNAIKAMREKASR
jgi:hypothetical protein